MEAAVVQLDGLAAATLRVPLPEPVTIGRHVIAEREYALVRAAGQEGAEGWAYGLTRGAPLTAMVNGLVAPHYRGGEAPAGELFEGALRSNPTVLSSGSGLRALSLADMAVWDLAARARGEPLSRLLGEHAERPLPALLVVGFPPSMSLEAVAAEASEMHALGWRTFKLAIGADRARTRARLEAAVVGPGARVVLDAAWSWRDAGEAASWIRDFDDLPIAWVEDPFPPGNAGEVARLREAIGVPLGTGDEQGGAYFPDALLDAGAVDVLRLDATAVGGVTGFLAAARAASGAATLSCHVHGHLHAQLLRGLGLDGWVEFGRPGSGVDPLGDDLLPEVEDGTVPPLALGGHEPALDEERLAQLGCEEPAAVLRGLALG